MATPFAALETRLATRCAAMLANATLTAGELSVDGVLDVALSEPGGGYLQARRAQFMAPSADFDGSGLDEDSAVTITQNGDATDYLLALPPSVSSGLTTLDLKRAAL